MGLKSSHGRGVVQVCARQIARDRALAGLSIK
jgi:hypothetical protein